MSLDRAMLAKIHIARKELGLSDDEYRDLLRMRFDAESAKDLTAAQSAELVAHFRGKGWKPKKGAEVKQGRTGTRRKNDNYIAISPGPAARQQRYALGLWAALGYDVAKIHTRSKTQFGVERFEWLTDERSLFTLITDLRARCERAGIDPSPR